MLVVLHTGCSKTLPFLSKQVINNTVDPVWDKSFDLDVADRGGLLKLVVFDRDVGSSDDFMGQMQVWLGGGKTKNVENAGGVGRVFTDKKFRLTDPHGKLIEAGGTSDAEQLGKLTLSLEEVAEKRMVKVYGATTAGLVGADGGLYIVVVDHNASELGRSGPAAFEGSVAVWRDFEVLLGVPGHGADLKIELYSTTASAGSDRFLGMVAFKKLGTAGAKHGNGADALLTRQWWPLCKKSGSTHKGASATEGARLDMELAEPPPPPPDLQADLIRRKKNNAPPPPPSAADMPVVADVGVIGEEWDAWLQTAGPAAPEDQRPMVRLEFETIFDGRGGGEVTAEFSVMIEPFHILQEGAEAAKHQSAVALKCAPMAAKARKAEAASHGLRGKIAGVVQARAWAQSRLARLPHGRLVDGLYHATDADGDGDLTRKELRGAPFGSQLAKYWIELDKDYDESVTIVEWRELWAGAGHGHHRGLIGELGWTESRDLLVELLWTSDAAVTARNSIGVGKLTEARDAAKLAEKERTKAEALAYFAKENEKAAKVDEAAAKAVAGEDLLGQAGKDMMAAMKKVEEARERAATARAAADAAEAARDEADTVAAEYLTQVEVCSRAKLVLDGLTTEAETEADRAGDEGFTGAIRLAEAAVAEAFELDECLALPRRKYKAARAGWLHICGGRIAASRMSPGGGNHVADVRHEMKAEGLLALVEAYAARPSQQACRQAAASMLGVAAARAVVGELTQIPTLLYHDAVKLMLEEGTADETEKSLHLASLQRAADARREAKREWLRAEGAAAWAADNQGAKGGGMVDDEMVAKARGQAVQAAAAYADSRKWAVGTRAGREALAVARQRLRVLEAMQDRDFPPNAAEARKILLEMGSEAVQLGLSSELEGELAGRYRSRRMALMEREGARLVLSKGFKEKAEAERRLRQQAAARAVAEQQRAALRRVQEAGAAGRAQVALDDAMADLDRRTKIQSTQPDVQPFPGDTVVLRPGMKETGCLKSRPVYTKGTVEFFEAASRRVKVRCNITDTWSWYNRTEVAFYGPLSGRELARLKAEAMAIFDLAKAEAEADLEKDAWRRQKQDDMLLEEQRVEDEQRQAKEAMARDRARKEIRTRIRSQLTAELAACTERNADCERTVCR